MDALLVFGTLGILLAIGMPLPIAIGAPGILYLVLHGGMNALNGLGLVSWGSTNSFTLTAVPMFILMAQIMTRSGLSTRVYQGLSIVLARIPGGLIQTNIAGCAILAATSGSSVATAASMGSVALPQLMARNYDPRLATGSLAAGGTLGILIPPSLAMIIYSAFTETSVSQLFMAGVVPGLLLTTMFMLYVGIHATFISRTAPVEDQVSLLDRIKALADIIPFAVLIGGTMGAMYFGWVTPTEAAALGCAIGLVISMIWGNVTGQVLRDSFRDTTIIIGNILFIVFAANIFSYAISMAHLGEDVTKFVISLNLDKVQFYIAVFALFTVMGCFIETMAMIVITVPLLFPIILAYGIDPVWFGILVVLFIELGQITPPIGINLFVIQSLWNGKFKDVVIGAIPFQLIMMLLVLIITVWPQVVLWLPQHVAAIP